MCSVEWWFERFPAVEADGSISWTSSVFLISYVIIINWFFFQVPGARLGRGAGGGGGGEGCWKSRRSAPALALLVGAECLLAVF